MKKVCRSTISLFLVLILAGTCTAAKPDTLIPGGNTIGLQLNTEGIAIVELNENMPEKIDLKQGDLIQSIDGTAVSSVEELASMIKRSEGKPLTLTVLRAGEIKEITAAPQKVEDGWKLGLYVKDSITGIGTVTYYDPDTGTFGALGHAVSDGHAEPLPIRNGSVLPSLVASVIRGKAGSPGALQGAVSGRNTSGKIIKNTSQGIFGEMEAPQGRPIPIATANQVHTGPATILSNVQGTEVEGYTVKILEIYPREEHDRNLLLEVTDPALLSKTGGIVQGMSGSPILQDGKLIGAVTHVLIDDPTQGYGIFIENMLDAAA